MVASLILPTGDLPVQLTPATTESYSSPTTPTTAVSSAIVQTAYRADIQNGHFVPRQSPPTRSLHQSDRSESLRSSDLGQEKEPSLAFPLRSGSFGEIRPSQPGLRPPPSESPPFSNLAPGDGLPSGYNLEKIPAKAAAILGLNDAGRNLPFPSSPPRKPLVPINRTPLSSFSLTSDRDHFRDSFEVKRAPFAKRNPPPAALHLPTPRFGQVHDGASPGVNERGLLAVENAHGAGAVAGRSCVDRVSSGAAAGGKRGADVFLSGRERKSSLAKLSVGTLTRSLSGRRGREAAPGMES